MSLLCTYLNLWQKLRFYDNYSTFYDKKTEIMTKTLDV